MNESRRDRIDIRGLSVRTIIGVLDDERERRQELVLHLTLHVDTRPAGRSDSLEDAVDYQEVTERVLRRVEGSRFFLLEALGESVARLLVEEMGIPRVTVRIEKPEALGETAEVCLTITRARGDFA